MSQKPNAQSLMNRLTCCIWLMPSSDVGKLSAALVLAMTLMLAGCDDSPRETTLSVLSAAQKNFDGRRVMVSGVLRTYDAPRHYWIENQALDRVALEGATELAPKVGQTIRVQGTFHYDQTQGRRISVEEIISSP